MAILVAHIGGALGAAAVRVYFDVAYGTETHIAAGMSSKQTSHGLEVNVDGLRKFDSFWGASSRLDRLASENIFNGTLSRAFPLDSKHDLGIGNTNAQLWYILEDAAFVFLLCICYVHIWLGAGVGEHNRPINNPYKRDYWKALFRTCILVTIIFMSLLRAFPTSHGSMHLTIFKAQYQVWNPNVKTTDTDNNETAWRIIGGILGVILAIGYNELLVGNENTQPDNDENSDFYYKLVWGLEPDRTYYRNGHASSSSRDMEQGSHSNRRNIAMYKVTTSETSVEDMKSAYPQNCTGPNCAACNTQAPRRSDFKLRIPHAMDHPK